MCSVLVNTVIAIDLLFGVGTIMAILCSFSSVCLWSILIYRLIGNIFCNYSLISLKWLVVTICGCSLLALLDSSVCLVTHFKCKFRCVFLHYDTRKTFVHINFKSSHDSYPLLLLLIGVVVKALQIFLLFTTIIEILLIMVAHLWAHVAVNYCYLITLLPVKKLCYLLLAV